MIIENRLAQLGIEIKEAVSAIANYVSVQQAGSLLFLSGAGPLRDGKPTMVGRLGENVTVEQGVYCRPGRCNQFDLRTERISERSGPR